MTEFEFGWLVGFFEGKGSYCNAPGFSLEAYSLDRVQLEMVAALVGGHIYPPPPSSPTRYYWRLYGPAALQLYERLRPHLSDYHRGRGDRKLRMSTEPLFEETS